jgi:hypothetical protein
MKAAATVTMDGRADGSQLSCRNNLLRTMRVVRTRSSEDPRGILGLELSSSIIVQHS